MMKVKICGITNLDDALAAVGSGADALGFNFYEKSQRYIDPALAATITTHVPEEIATVGVFVNSDVEELAAVVRQTSIDFVQLHGDESPAYVDAVRAASAVRIIKALRVLTESEFALALDYDVDGFLLDSYSPSFGGSGEIFDWDLAIRFKSIVPQFFLAGGLTPENVGNAIRQVRPYGVDVASGVESSKGRKNHAKMAAFIENAKSEL